MIRILMIAEVFSENLKKDILLSLMNLLKEKKSLRGSIGPVTFAKTPSTWSFNVTERIDKFFRILFTLMAGKTTRDQFWSRGYSKKFKMSLGWSMLTKQPL